MTYKTYRKTNKAYKILPPHGGYKNLESYKNAVIIRQGTKFFTKRWIKSLKQREQMNGAARSSKQCIVEGSLISGTSKKSEIKLLGVSRGSYEELLEDFIDFLVDRGLKVWDKDDPRALAVRRLAYKKNKSYRTYKSYIESDDPEEAANAMICLIKQTSYLLDRQKKAAEKDFLEKGGLTEMLYWERRKAREK